jgi:hypothetical protein
MQPDADSLWGIYLVDVFDNCVLIKELPGHALLEPTPVRKTLRPPVVPSKVDLERREATVYMADVYAGPGLQGIPRGEVKELRVYTYNFAFHGVGGQYNRVGLDGPWDIRQVLGTVPVEPDGSAYFRVPANYPVGVQPLDAEGKALQLMRSWMTAMPGETLSCVGCHEQQSSAAPNQATLAARRTPSPITPFYGPTRGFSFVREVQPVLDAHCIGCHDGERAVPDLRHAEEVHVEVPSPNYTRDMAFSPAYLALRRHVRGHTMESDMHLLTPMEFHADTTRLIRMLESGHQGVELDAEAWDRLITWIDMNTPYHGTWAEIPGLKGADMIEQRGRRNEALARYAGRHDDAEQIHNPYTPPKRVAIPTALPASGQEPLQRTEWTPASTATMEQQPAVRTVDLGNGVLLELVRLPGMPYPPAGPKDPGVTRPFWVGRYEVTNTQYAQFDPDHDSRLESGDFLHFTVAERGWPVNAPEQPVCRVSWNEALAFCDWLSQRTALEFDLPSEAEWEYACRAGTASPMHYGTQDDDFAPFANLADASLAHVDAAHPKYKLPHNAVPAWRPAVTARNDGHRVSAPVGSFSPNAWGLFDMHGNVAEWTAGILDASSATRKHIVRGGSWYSLPEEATAAHRVAYRSYQRVFDVGFRVVCTEKRIAAN